MKKIFLIFFGTSLFAQSQNPYATTISIIKMSPDTVCIGDTVHIAFSYTAGATLNPGETPTTGIQIYDQSLVNNGYVFQGDEALLANYPTQNINGTTCHVIKYKIPSNYYTNQTNTPSVLHIGTYKVYGRNGGQNLTSINKDCQFVYTAPTNTDTPTGIEELSQDPANLTPIYYDVTGLQVEKRPGVVLIEKMGNRRRKVIFQ